MCGIFGYIGNMHYSVQDAAHSLLSAIFSNSNVRGKDASGFACKASFDGTLVTEKRNIDSAEFVSRSVKFNALRHLMPSVFIGHTRHSTSGDPKMNRNNHPFRTKRWAMVHNGRVEDWRRVVSESKLNLRSETDSEVIVHLLDGSNDAIAGMNAMVKTVPSESKYALAFMEHTKGSPHSLYLFRNTYNPCYVMRVKKWNMMYFASTEVILEQSLKDLYGQDKLADTKKSLDITIELVESFHLHEFTLNPDNSISLAKTKVVEPVKPVIIPSYGPNMGYTPSVNPLCGEDGPEDDAGFPEGAGTFRRPLSTARFANPAIGNTTGDSTGSEIIILKKEELDRISEDTSKSVVSLQETINKCMRMAKSIGSSPFMTEEELKDFTSWAGL